MKILSLKKFLIFSVLVGGLNCSLMAVQKDSILLINSKEQFLGWFNTNRRLQNEDLVWRIILGNNIDLEGESLLPFKNFRGSFEGGCFTLSNFQINVEDGGAGVFEDLDGSIRNLALQNVRVSSMGNNVGVLTGTVLSGSIISNCMVADSKVQGKNLVGVIAGANLGNIENCLVVNDTLVSISEDPSVYLGGIVGKNCVDHMVSNCVVMMDLFYLHTSPTKNGNVGRIAGGEGILKRNYGWGEVGFALWSKRSNSYYYKYYPNWTAEESYIGTGDCTTTAKHGGNFFVGDCNSQVSPICSDFNFWALISEFNFNFWDFPAESKYPRLINSKINTKNLITRRGFEHDQKDYSEGNPVTKIGTALMFTKMVNDGKMYGKDTLQLGTDIQLISSDLQENKMWGIDINAAEKGNTENCLVECNYCPFDGMGHEIAGVRVNNPFGSIGVIGNAKNHIVRTAVRNFNGGYFFNNSTISFSAGTLVGELQNKGIEIKNCLVSGTFFSLSSANTVDIGGLIGCSIGASKIEHNIVRGLFLQGRPLSSNFANVGGIMGSMTIDNPPFMASNFVDAQTENDRISAHSFDYPKGGRAGWIVGNVQGVSADHFADCYYKGDFTATFSTQDSLGYDGEAAISYQELWEKMELSPTYWQGLDTDKPYLKKEELTWDF